MNFEWRGTKCILCLSEEGLSKEHIIPKSLGGILTCRFLCRSCNSTLGSELEAEIKSDPTILLLAAHAGGVNARLDKLVGGHPQIGESRLGPVKGFMRNDEFRVNPAKLEDGSLIKPSDQTPKTVITMLERSAIDPPDIGTLREKLGTIEDNQEFEIASGITVINWPIWNVKPDLSKSIVLNHLVPAIIAYEFLALLLGTAICGTNAALRELRRVFVERSCGSRALSVDRLHADRVGASLFHGIFFEGNDPYAKLQIRLLGKLTFRVHFHHLAVNSPHVRYTHNLKTNSDDWSVLDDTA